MNLMALRIFDDGAALGTLFTPFGEPTRGTSFDWADGAIYVSGEGRVQGTSLKYGLGVYS